MMSRQLKRGRAKREQVFSNKRCHAAYLKNNQMCYKIKWTIKTREFSSICVKDHKINCFYFEIVLQSGNLLG